MQNVLVTGSAGLVGSEAARVFASLGYRVIGMDTDARAQFFGREASTRPTREALTTELRDRYVHYDVDIRDRRRIEELFRTIPFTIIIHAAAQPSHEWSARDPHADFSVNATGTLVLLEAARHYCREAVFIFTSTNKVYGDRPNTLPLVERETRFEIDPAHAYADGIDETMSLDASTHSVFGASKVAADILVQEYGRYFGMPTGVFRASCITGAAHAPTETHGFLAYLVRCIAAEREYTICGYKGKQVRDIIHAGDVAAMFHEFSKNPRPGEVYNVGGGRHANISVREALARAEDALGRKARFRYLDRPRRGDHIWYVSDVSKFRAHYPSWTPSYTLDTIMEELCAKWSRVQVTTPATAAVALSGTGRTHSP